jgi:hypothetical protein
VYRNQSDLIIEIQAVFLTQLFYYLHGRVDFSRNFHSFDQICIDINFYQHQVFILLQINIFMLIEHSRFVHYASVPWPLLDQEQMDWIYGVEQIEQWLVCHVGSHLSSWTWADSGASYRIGVGFRWDQDRTLFVLTWS